MTAVALWTAVLLGVLQGVLEWLPVSSEGAVTLALTVLFGLSAVDAVGLSLFLHAGTGLAAAVYYRRTLAGMARAVSGPGRADERPDAERRRRELALLVVASLVSAVTGAVAYAALRSVVSALTGGGFVAAVGVLLVGTGLFQYRAAGSAIGRRGDPGLADAVLVGALQGLAVLPGVSRSGVTTGAFLLRGHGARESFRLSFLLSVPAALGACALAVADAGGLPSVAPLQAGTALVASACVGLLTMDALLRVVERTTIWAVCVGFGLLTLVGAGLLAL